MTGEGNLPPDERTIWDRAASGAYCKARLAGKDVTEAHKAACEVAWKAVQDERKTRPAGK